MNNLFDINIITLLVKIYLVNFKKNILIFKPIEFLKIIFSYIRFSVRKILNFLFKVTSIKGWEPLT